MTNSNKIAVIILTYNRFEEFKLALKSALIQKDVRFHVFVFDNGSEKPILGIIPKDSRITHIRHKKNIGFAANFKYATNYVKNKGFKYSFLLGDDDIIAYPYVLRDLYKIMNKDSEIHIVKGGYVEFIRSVPHYTRIFILNKYECKRALNLPEIDKALLMHTTSYSGILFKNDFFNPYFSPYNDLITPFIAPILKILTKKKISFLPDKITVLVKTDHQQLATVVYNENVSNQDALEKVFKLIGKKYKRHVSLIELINYKIYSSNRKYINNYYKECLKSNKGLKSISYIIAYRIPSNILAGLKSVTKWIKSVSVKKDLIKNHQYMDKALS